MILRRQHGASNKSVLRSLFLGPGGRDRIVKSALSLQKQRGSFARRNLYFNKESGLKLSGGTGEFTQDA